MADRRNRGEADFVPDRIRDWAHVATNRAFLDAVFTSFDRVGDWPRRPELQRDLAASGQPMHLHELELRMPRELGFSDPPDQRTVLLTFGIYFCSQGRPLLEQYVAALKLAIARYRDRDVEPTLKRSDLTEELQLDELSATKLSRVLLREAPFLGSGYGDPSDWQREIHESIVAFFHVETVEDYLELRARQLQLATADRLFVSDTPAQLDSKRLEPSGDEILTDEVSAGTPLNEEESSTPAATSTRGRDSVSALISWAHSEPEWTAAEQREWKKTMLTFAGLLRANGVDADIDLYQSTPTDWARWGTRGIQRSDFVLVVVSRAWKVAWHDEGEPTEGSGAVAEANFLHDLFRRDRQAFLSKVILVLLPGASEENLPEGLGATAQWVRVRSLDADGLEQLLRLLWDQPEHPKPPLGQRPTLPPDIDPIQATDAESDPDVEARRQFLERELGRLDDALGGLPRRDVGEREDAPWESARHGLERHQHAAKELLAGLETPDPRRFQPRTGVGTGSFNLHLPAGPLNAHLENIGGSAALVDYATLRTPIGDFEGVMWVQEGQVSSQMPEPTTRVPRDGYLIITFGEGELHGLAQASEPLRLSVVYRRADHPAQSEYMLELLRTGSTPDNRPQWRPGQERLRNLGSAGSP